MNHTLLTLSLVTLCGASLPAAAGVQNCVTINGHETCASAERSLACQTIDGKTTCVGDDGSVIIHQHSQSVEPLTPWSSGKRLFQLVPPSGQTPPPEPDDEDDD